jgi:hypothetical protein
MGSPSAPGRADSALRRRAVMNCSLGSVYAYLALALVLLRAALTAALLWTAALPLFVAAGLVATVAYFLIPRIKDAQQAYAACRGPSGKCTISPSTHTLGQAAATFSVIAFAAAAALQLTALALIATWILAWLGMTVQAAVALLLHAGMYSGAITLLLLIGVMSNAALFKSCMDQQPSGATLGSGGLRQ